MMNKVFGMLARLLALCLVVGLMPGAAFAASDTGKALQLVENGTAANISGGGTNSYIYYGAWNGEPILWRVLSTDGNGGRYQDAGGNAYGGSPLFLLSNELLGTGSFGSVYFDNSSRKSNAWQGSTAQAWCKNFAGENGSFTAAELRAILATTKSDGAFVSSTYVALFDASHEILKGEKVFFLSAEEAETAAYGFVDDSERIANYNGAHTGWWLRSPFHSNSGYSGVVNYEGIVGSLDVDYDWTARPAFNLNLHDVLFTSAADGGKDAGGALAKIPSTDTNAWKLTLLDRSRNFSVSETALPAAAGSAVELTYTGAAVGDNEYISAILADKDGVPQCYGRVLKPTSAEGTVRIALPGDLASADASP